METTTVKPKVKKLTAEILKSLNSAELRKAATQLEIKNSKKYAKDDLLKLCLKKVKPTEEVKEEKVQSPVVVGEQKADSIEKVDVTKFPTSVEKEGKTYYQYYPYKKKFEGNLLSVFRKRNSDGKGSVSWVEDSRGKKLFESKSWDESYFTAIKLRNENYKDAKVVVYFDSEIPVPGSYGKTYN